MTIAIEATPMNPDGAVHPIDVTVTAIRPAADRHQPVRTYPPRWRTAACSRTGRAYRLASAKRHDATVLARGSRPFPCSYTLGIKRDPNSRGASRYIFEEMRIGHALTISAPRNHFPLIAVAPHHVLIAGGIGVTPIFAMTQKLRADGSSFELHYAGRSRSQLAFLDNLRIPPSHTFIAMTNTGRAA